MKTYIQGTLSFWKLFLSSQNEKNYSKTIFGWLDSNDNIKWKEKMVNCQIHFNAQGILHWYK